jgi:hypothetical protein
MFEKTQHRSPAVDRAGTTTKKRGTLAFDSSVT